MSEIRLTVGHIARHTPPGAGAQGRDAAIIDIAQDLLLRDRSIDEFDEEDIGALAVPVPTATELSDALRTHFRFLAELDDSERTIAGAREHDRPLALRMLTDLPGGRLARAGLY